MKNKTKIKKRIGKTLKIKKKTRRYNIKIGGGGGDGGDSKINTKPPSGVSTEGPVYENPEELLSSGQGGPAPALPLSSNPQPLPSNPPPPLKLQKAQPTDNPMYMNPEKQYLDVAQPPRASASAEQELSIDNPMYGLEQEDAFKNIIKLGLILKECEELFRKYNRNVLVSVDKSVNNCNKITVYLELYAKIIALREQFKAKLKNFSLENPESYPPNIVALMNIDKPNLTKVVEEEQRNQSLMSEKIKYGLGNYLLPFPFHISINPNPIQNPIIQNFFGDGKFSTQNPTNIQPSDTQVNQQNPVSKSNQSKSPEYSKSEYSQLELGKGYSKLIHSQPAQQSSMETKQSKYSQNPESKSTASKQTDQPTIQQQQPSSGYYDIAPKPGQTYFDVKPKSSSNTTEKPKLYNSVSRQGDPSSGHLSVEHNPSVQQQPSTQQPQQQQQPSLQPQQPQISSTYFYVAPDSGSNYTGYLDIVSNQTSNQTVHPTTQQQPPPVEPPTQEDLAKIALTDLKTKIDLTNDDKVLTEEIIKSYQNDGAIQAINSNVSTAVASFESGPDKKLKITPKGKLAILFGLSDIKQEKDKFKISNKTKNTNNVKTAQTAQTAQTARFKILQKLLTTMTPELFIFIIKFTNVKVTPLAQGQTVVYLKELSKESDNDIKEYLSEIKKFLNYKFDILEIKGRVNSYA
jgi:hypothetical protein